MTARPAAWPEMRKPLLNWGKALFVEHVFW